jgi:hypothetical protein
MPRTRIAITTGDWELLAQSVTAEDRENIPQLEQAHAQLLDFVEEIHKLVAERDFHEARKREATEKIQRLLERGRKKATVLRVHLKFGLGDDSEELVRFGMKPLRHKKRPKKSKSTRTTDGSPPSEEPST